MAPPSRQPRPECRLSPSARRGESSGGMGHGDSSVERRFAPLKNLPAERRHMAQGVKAIPEGVDAVSGGPVRDNEATRKESRRRADLGSGGFIGHEDTLRRARVA